MPASIKLPNEVDNRAGEYKLRRILLAHDNSYAAQQAFKDAEALALRFHAEIILVRVVVPNEEYSGRALSSKREEDSAELESLVESLSAKGISSRTIVRAGLVGDTLFHIAHQEKADLLLLGAYGLGSQDRQTLGSTAEHLLRAIPCPVLTFGPHATSGLLQRLEAVSSLLVAVPLPFQSDWLQPAVQIAQLFGKEIELVHVTQTSRQRVEESKSREQCEALAAWVREQGVAANWTIFSGVPSIFVHACAEERKSAVIVLPLQRRDRLSSITSDNVAAQIIRQAKIPVLSYRID